MPTTCNTPLRTSYDALIDHTSYPTHGCGHSALFWKEMWPIRLIHPLAAIFTHVGAMLLTSARLKRRRYWKWNQIIMSAATEQQNSP